MTVWVEVLGSMDRVRVAPWEEVRSGSFRYVCTDFEQDLDVFESRETGELVATRVE